MTSPLRFGVNATSPRDRSGWREFARRVEGLGYDTLAVADHLGMPPVFPSLAAAAEVTERVRLGTFVLNAGFWNPTLLAREAAGTDLLTDGRLELGLGAGYVRAEFEAAGLPYPSARRRVEHLEHTVAELTRLFADPEHAPAPAQRPGPPLLVGGGGDRVLTLAARHADIVGFTGLGVGPDGALRTSDVDSLAERVAFARAAAGERTPEYNLLVQQVVVTDDRAAAVARLAERDRHLTVEQVGALPYLFVGTVEQIAEQVRGVRERFGIGYFTVLESAADVFAPVRELLR